MFETPSSLISLPLWNGCTSPYFPRPVFEFFARCSAPSCVSLPPWTGDPVPPSFWTCSRSLFAEAFLGIRNALFETPSCSERPPWGSFRTCQDLINPEQLANSKAAVRTSLGRLLSKTSLGKSLGEFQDLQRPD